MRILAPYAHNECKSFEKPAMSRKVKSIRLLLVVLAAAWTSALVTVAWNAFRPSILTDGTQKSGDNDAASKTVATALRDAEVQPTSLPLPGGGLPIKAADGSTDAQTRAPHRLPDGIVENRLPAEPGAALSSEDPPEANRPRRLSSEPDTPAGKRAVVGQLSSQGRSGRWQTIE